MNKILPALSVLFAFSGLLGCTMDDEQIPTTVVHKQYGTPEQTAKLKLVIEGDFTSGAKEAIERLHVTYKSAKASAALEQFPSKMATDRLVLEPGTFPDGKVTITAKAYSKTDESLESRVTTATLLPNETVEATMSFK